jgi:mRNA interferase MazF
MLRPMRDFDIWDVIKVPFPYTDRPLQQRRPALVVARHAAPGMPVLLWVLMITSASHRRWPGDVDVSDLPQAGLPAPSIVRPAKLATIEAKDAEVAGQLPLPDRQAVMDFLLATLREAAGARG